MLLKGYETHLSFSECNASQAELQCIAQLDESIEQVLPYLNTVLSGWQFTREPPSLTLRTEDKVIVIHPREITINRVADEAEADRILHWLKEVINDTWSTRERIHPRYEGHPRPNIVELLRLLRDADCTACGRASCVAIAVDLAEAGTEDEATSLDCLEMGQREKTRLESYLSQFRL